MELPQTRRQFLDSMGALYAAGMVPRQGSEPAAQPAPPPPAGVPRTLEPALASNDFAFAPGLIYMNTGSLGPTPRPVMEKTMAVWKQLQLDPVAYGYGELETGMNDVRARAASFLGAKTSEVVLTRSTTEGMNWTAQGFSFAAGDHILTTDQEHPGGTSCWEYVARRFGLTLDKVAIPPGEHDAGAIVDRIAAAITPRTRVLSFSHVLTSTGLRMPAAELCALARARGVVSVVDGAQSLGSHAVDVKRMGCHVFAAPGHKWLLAPPGTGVLYLSEELGNTIDAIALQAGRDAYSASSGVTDIPFVHGAGAALEYVSALGISNIENHNLRLSARTYDALRSVPKLRVVSAPPGPLASALVTFWLPETHESGAFQNRMHAKHNIRLKVVPRNWGNGLRVSHHLFNSEQHVDALAAALKAELA
jgi:selenocysteine lyase/cysteine desulfurase